MIKEYDDFIEWVKKNDIVNSRNTLRFISLPVNRQSKAKNLLYIEAENKLKELTSFLPKETLNKYRLQCVLKNITQNNFKCSVFTCDNPREFWPGLGFTLLCSCRDTEHKEYQGRAKADGARKTFRKKYGVDNISQLTSVKEKKKKTTLKNYGVYNPTYKNYNIYNFNRLTKKVIEDNFIASNHLEVDKLSSFLNCKRLAAYTISDKFNVNRTPKNGSSRAELEIYNFIKSLDDTIQITRNTRKIILPKELDIYLPDHNLAIEYNGLMDHSQGVSKYSRFNTPELPKNKHLQKTEACEEKNIQLVHIFENEWTDLHKQKIWKSVICNKLGKNSNKLYARKLELREIKSKVDREEAKILFRDNHLQGSGALGPIRFGLFQDKKLISCMTFGRSRFHKESIMELIRFATIKGTSVVGGASRLLKAFEREYSPDKLISYANRRWSNGGLYHTLGFDLSHISKPNYFYFKESKHKLWSRNHFQRHKLEGYFGKQAPTLTESEIMFAQDYRRIYDSGNLCFVKVYQKRMLQNSKYKNI